MIVAARLRHLLRRAWRLAKVGVGTRQRLKIGVVVATMPVKRRIGVLRARGVRLRVGTHARSMAPLVWDDSELSVLAQLFVTDKYELYLDDDAPTIIDLGSNTGLSVLYFNMLFPRATIVAVEPDPTTFLLLQENAADLGNVILKNVAITSHDGPVTFFPTPDSWASSLTPSARGGTPVMVEGRTLDSLLRDLGIGRVDVLKVAVEGAEYDALKNFTGLDRVRIVLGHPRPSRAGVTAREFFSLLEAFRVETDWEGEGSLFKAYNLGSDGATPS